MHRYSNLCLHVKKQAQEGEQTPKSRAGEDGILNISLPPIQPETLCVAQNDLELMMLLPLLPKHRDSSLPYDTT